MALNSFQGVNSVGGVSSLQDASRLSELQGNRRVNLGNISDTGLRSNLQSALGATGRNDYSKFNVPTLNELNAAYGKIAPQQSLQNLTFGDQGYGRQDIGAGKYNILDQSGSVLGVGYKPVSEAVQELYRDQLGLPTMETRQKEILGKYSFLPDYLNQSRPQQEGGLGLEMGPDYWLRKAGLSTKWKEQEALRSAADEYNALTGSIKSAQEKLSATPFRANIMTDWERLGQLLNPEPEKFKGYKGSPLEEFDQQRQQTKYDRFRLPINSRNEVIAGENTLYGSTPVFSNGKLVGYRTSLGPNTERNGPGSNPYGFNFIRDKGESYSQAYLGRQLNNVDQWEQLVTGLGGQDVLVPLANASKLPGWTNVEKTQYWERPENSFATQLMKVAVPAAINYFVPGAGNIVSAAVSRSEGNDAGMWGNLILGGMNMSGISGDLSNMGGAPVETAVNTSGQAANTMGSSAGGLFGSGISLGSAGANAAVQGGLTSGAVGGLSQALAGKGSDAILGAMTSGALSGGLGQYLTALGGGYSPLASAALRTGSGSLIGGLQSKLRGGDFQEGATSGAASGLLSSGLGALGRYADSSGYGNTYRNLAPMANPLISRLISQSLRK